MNQHSQREQPVYRPLLPAPTGAHKEPAHPRKGARTNACEICRTRKSKCDGAKPTCGACVSRDTLCRYGETEARQIRRRYQQLKEKRTAQEDLYDMLQVMPERDAADVFRRVRGGAKAEAIVRHVQEGSLLLELALTPTTRTHFEFPYVRTIPPALLDSVYFRSHIFEAIRASDLSSTSSPTSSADEVARQSNYGTPLYGAEMIDRLLAEVQPSKWTRVSSNDLLLRKLLEGYFMYEYPWQFFFHKDYFLEDMVSGANRFCSPVLVNALLAKACTCSRIAPDSNKYWDPDTLAYRFLAEAKRLWELEDEGTESKLTTVHAGCLITSVMDDIGHDKIGVSYATKALRIAHSLGVFRSPLTNDLKMNDAKAFTAWGLFSWLTVQSYYYFKPPYISRPPPQELPNVEVSSPWYSEIWLRYPNDDLLYPMGFGYNMKALCNLRTILRDICAVCFVGDEEPRKMPWSQVSAFQVRLQAWCEELPAVLSPRSLLYPAHIKLHCEFYSVVIMLFDAQLSPVENDGSPLSEGQRSAARDITRQATAQLESLLRIYYLRHSFESYDSMLLVHLVHLGNLAFSRLTKLEQDEAYPRDSLDTVEAQLSTLILCLKGLHDQSKNFYLSGVVLSVMKNRLSAENRNLVGQHITLKDPDHIQEPINHSEPIKSDYVIPVVNLNEDPSLGRLENMVHRFRRSSHDD